MTSMTRRKMKRYPVRGALYAAAALSVLTAAACSSSGSTQGAGSAPGSNSSSQGDLNIVGVLPLTGELGPIGVAEKAGMEAEIYELNQSGGILGRKVVLNIQDSAGDPQQAVSAMRSLLANPSQVDAVVSEATASLNSAVLPIVTDSGKLSVTTASGTSTGSPTLHPRDFSFGEPAKLVSYASITALRQLGYTKIGLVGEGDNASTATLAYLTEEAPKYGMQIVGTEDLDPSSTDDTAELQKLRSAGAQVIAGQVDGTAIGVETQGIENLNWTSAKILGDIGWAASPLYSLIPQAVQGQVVVTDIAAGTRIDGKLSPVQTAFIKAMNATGGSFDSLTTSAAGADEILGIKYAFDKAGTTNGAAAAKAMEGMSTDPAAKNYPWVFYAGQSPDFSASDHDSSNINPSKFFTLVTVAKPVDGSYAGAYLGS
jgi:ABC-type branched-subunit amino acid transport system substrate-binding protein